ncbi:hypothetical protein M9Y10_001348 [Tritrichomonas musculus]|uniref:Surface antigen BspA-like n=1 Tax=Tritrichomonas musculus TaxID=1915356 RepID=A0ABR2L6R8_9EUKA
MVKKIEDNAFESSSIESINIPVTVTEFGNNVFNSCNKLKSIQIPQNSPIFSLGENAFFNTLIDKFDVPSKVKILHSSTFSICDELKSITTKLVIFSFDLYEYFEVIKNIKQNRLKDNIWRLCW